MPQPPRVYFDVQPLSACEVPGWLVTLMRNDTPAASALFLTPHDVASAALLVGLPVRTADAWIAMVCRQMQIALVNENTAQDRAPRGARL